MELVININIDNAAFCDIPGQEVARILREYCDKIEKNDDIKSLFERFNDFNGNRIGTATVMIEPDRKYIPENDKNSFIGR